MASSSTPDWSVDQQAYVTDINDVVLPGRVRDYVEQYEAVYGERDEFLWRWIYSLLPEFTLSSVDHEHGQTVRTQKTLLTILVTLLDDLAEVDDDVHTFESIRHRILSDRRNVPGPEVDSEVVAFADDLWRAIESELVEAPCYDDVTELFYFDLRQGFNAMDYSRVLNTHPMAANLTGIEQYCPHNMIMFPYADIDLMFSSAFDRSDLGVLRELIWELQKMARIGNSLTTWEREIEENDYTAAIIVYALQEDIVTRDQLADPERHEAVIEEIHRHDVEERFVDEWWQRYRTIVDRGYEAESVDLDAFIQGMETVMEYHVASKGLK